MNGKHNCVEKRTDWSISMELDQEKQNQEAAERCRAGTVTLVFGAKDERHNNALVLKHYLDHRP